jgi:hypothetical protein
MSSRHCRHLREKAKNKNDFVLTTAKRQQHPSSNICDGRMKRNIETIHEIDVEQSEDNKENDEHF